MGEAGRIKIPEARGRTKYTRAKLLKFCNSVSCFNLFEKGSPPRTNPEDRRRPRAEPHRHVSCSKNGAYSEIADLTGHAFSDRNKLSSLCPAVELPTQIRCELVLSP